MEPNRCKSPACGAWTFNSDGYCSDVCGRNRREPALSAARGAGVVTPPHKVRFTAVKRVRRNEGYVAKNGAWIASETAPFTEVSRDHRELDRKRDAHRRAAERSIARAVAGKTPRVKTEKTPRVRIVAEDRKAQDRRLMQGIGTIHDAD